MAAEINVAVASNFTHAMITISEHFETRTGHRITLIFGSTGKHYAQIKNGAPFDIFFAADRKRPERLEKEGLAVPGSRFTYAIGKLVLWSPIKDYTNSEAKTLEKREFHHLAIANPKLAPYGRAAHEVLQSLGLWDKLNGLIIRGENISQAFQFVKSGNAELGFVSYSQIKHPEQAIQGSFWDIPQIHYNPIEQQAIQLKESKTARLFLIFVQNHEVREMIRGYGYNVP